MLWIQVWLILTDVPYAVTSLPSIADTPVTHSAATTIAERRTDIFFMIITLFQLILISDYFKIVSVGESGEVGCGLVEVEERYG